MEVGEPRIVTAPESNSETCTEPDFPIDPESPKDGKDRVVDHAPNATTHPNQKAPGMQSCFKLILPPNLAPDDCAIVRGCVSTAVMRPVALSGS